MSAPVLAFDTSTESMSIALDSSSGRLLWNGPGGALSSASLLPQLQAMLAQHALAFGSLAAIGFGSGPGAFTGLRTACAVAQGLAMGAGIPAVPVDSLMIVAEDARLQAQAGTVLDIGVAMDARMGELYVARYSWSGQDWEVTQAPALCSPQALIECWRDDGPAMLAGNGVPAIQAGLASSPVCEGLHDRADALLCLVRRSLARGAIVDAALALPTYLRDKVALTTVERLARHSAVETAR